MSRRLHRFRAYDRLLNLIRSNPGITEQAIQHAFGPYQEKNISQGLDCLTKSRLAYLADGGYYLHQEDFTHAA